MRKALQVVAAYIEQDDWVLLDRRKEGSHMAGLWEFPGGKVEPGETLEAALARELQEELGVASKVGAEIARVHHAYDDFDLTLILFDVELQGTPAAVGVAEISWFERWRLRELDMPPADRPLVEAIERIYDDTIA